MERVRDAYASNADLYIELFGAAEKVSADDLALFERHLATKRGVVLDVGCGPGHITAYLRSLGVDAAGIDIVPEFVAHARAAHPDGKYAVGSMLSLDAGNGSVAGILSWYSMIHLPPQDLPDALAEFRRVLAPGGTLVIGFVDNAGDGEGVTAFDHKVVTAYRWPADAFSERLARAGFTEVERSRRPSDGTQRSHAAIAAVLDR